MRAEMVPAGSRSAAAAEGQWPERLGAHRLAALVSTGLIRLMSWARALAAAAAARARLRLAARAAMVARALAAAAAVRLWTPSSRVLAGAGVTVGL